MASKSKPCPECGTSLDEIPFDVSCQTHRRHLASLPEITDEEWLEANANELLRCVYERLGDD